MFKLTKQITAADIRSHHINRRSYASDMEYVKVAQYLQTLITSLSGGKYINNEVAMDLAIRLTLHLEDTVADAGVWRGFCTGHKRLYGRYMPFQWGDCEVPLDEVTPQSCAFIIWMTLTSYDNMRYTSPMMPAVNALGKAVYEYLNGIFDDMAINDEMLDDMYSERVLGDFYKMRDVLSWLSDAEGCYMSYWNVTVDGYAQEIDSWRKHLSEKRHINYQVRSIMPFKEKVGPLALLPQEWYADMLSGHEDMGVRKYSDKIKEIKFKRFDTYKIMSLEELYLTLQGVDKDVIKTEVKGFGFDLADIPEGSNLLIGAFVYYIGCWHVSGVSSFSTLHEDFDSVIKKHLDSVKNNELEISIYKKFIDKNNGQRLYYFHSFDEMKEWHEGIVKSKDPDKLFDETPNFIKKSNKLLVYLPTDGGFEIAEGLCDPICDDNNTFYDEEISRQDSMYILDSDALRGECVQYIISHDGLRNLSFAGSTPIESHTMAQDNLDFLARYYRRHMY